MGKNSFDFALHHVGGRSATTSFARAPVFFEMNLVRVLYEADVSCIEQVKAECDKRYQKYHILPYCLSDAKGSEPLHLKHDRYESSLIEPEPVESPLFVENPQFGWDLDMHGVDKVEEVAVTTLDQLLVDNEGLRHVPMPDFLSLDVESAEPKVLSGCRWILKNKCIAVKCEFDLDDTYPELRLLFSQYDFAVSDIELFDVPFKYSRQIPLGLKMSKRRSTAGEITVFKSPEAIVANHGDPLCDLIKAAFLALFMFDMEMSHRYMDAIRSFPDSAAFMEAHSDVHYIKFMAIFMKVMQTYPDIYSPRFSTVYPTAQARSERFKDSPEHPDAASRLAENTRVHERSMRDYFTYVNERDFKEPGFPILSRDYVGVEQVLASAGMVEHADLFKENRLQGMKSLLELLRAKLADAPG